MRTFNFSDSTYQIIEIAKTWIDAKLYAESINANLAIISSQAENDEIIRNALNYISSSSAVADGGDSRYIWIGGSDLETEGTFKWINGNSLSGSYTNWGSGFVNEPDDFDGQDALAMALESWPVGGGIGTAGEWNDIDENNLIYFVVEFNENTLNTSITSTLEDNYLNLFLSGISKINGSGNSRNNYIVGNTAANILNGFAGDDTIDGAVGTDTLIGGLGNDIYYVDATKDTIVEKVNEGIDVVFASVTYTLGKNLEQLTLSGTTSIHANGNELGNTILGNTASNSINGAAGNDFIQGEDGNDTLIGGAGDDTIYAGAGDDTITTTSGMDWIYGGEGNDRIIGSKDGDHLEGNAGDDNITGAAGNDALWGSYGNDIIKGDAGADHIWGGAGNDTLSGGKGIDRFHFGLVELGANNIDTITDFKGDEIYLYGDPFINQAFVSVNNVSNANLGEGVIYERSTGTLYYDDDGAGIGAVAIAFAILVGKPDITISNLRFDMIV